MGKLKLRYIFASIIAVYLLLQDLYGVKPFQTIWVLLLLTILYLINRIEKNKQDKADLSRLEKFCVITTSLLFNTVAFAFYYFCLRGVKTKKAKQTIKYSIISTLVLLAPIIILILAHDIIRIFS